MDDFRGGLLADDMGLGKTLMMIVAIVSTLSSAEKHAQSNGAREPGEIISRLTSVKSTLVLVPSACRLPPFANRWADD